MKIVVGLGNVGGAYDGTRHNIGFWVVDSLAKVYSDLPSWDKRYRALWMRCRIQDQPIGVLKPTTYMNRSGEAVLSAMTALRIPARSFLIIYDDFDLPLGTIRYRESGSGGSHNGMRSVVNQLGISIPRLRIGIGPKPAGDDTSQFVLTRFTTEEMDALDQQLPLIQERIFNWITNDHN